VKSHENQGGKLVFKTLGRYQILKTDGRQLTIESDDGIRTINGNHASRAPEPPEGDPAWARALAAWRIPSLPSSASKSIGAVFDHFFGQGYDDKERLVLKVRWFGYGPREDSWPYVEDLPAEKVRQYCQRHQLKVRRRASAPPPLVRGGVRGSRRRCLRSRRPPPFPPPRLAPQAGAGRPPPCRWQRRPTTPGARRYGTIA